jgi:hypothetical protein
MKDWIHGINWWLLALAVAIWWGGRKLATNAAKRAAERRKEELATRKTTPANKPAPGETMKETTKELP